jgi:hypothetical protein
MLKRGIFAIFLATMFAFTTQSANAEPIDQKVYSVAAVTSDVATSKIYSVAAVTSDVARSDDATQICNKSSVSGEYQQTEKADGSFDVANLQCGIPPIPPLGCRVGACMCDQYGRNCQWTFVCN